MGTYGGSTDTPALERVQATLRNLAGEDASCRQVLARHLTTLAADLEAALIGAAALQRLHLSVELEAPAAALERAQRCVASELRAVAADILRRGVVPTGRVRASLRALARCQRQAQRFWQRAYWTDLGDGD
ncbi:MAG: hypothetical protein IT384_15400 [Deltaproteobacteria bacterium]|nr:hypothetical protein [Deltaproteobacteria bacterium]